MCCLQEVRWKGQGAWFMSVKGGRYNFWRSANSDGTGDVGVLVKEELREKVVRRQNHGSKKGRRGKCRTA